MERRRVRAMSTTVSSFFPVTVFASLARFGFAALLLIAAGPKVLDPAAFVTAVGHYRLLPASAAVVVGHTLPWLEVTTALGLLVGRRWLGGAWLLATGLSAVFLGAVASAWWRGLDIRCGCFGGDAPISGLSVLARLALLLVALAAAWHACRRPVNGAPSR